MEEYGIWDVTGFGCTINTILGIRTSKYEDGYPVVYLFASCEFAERYIYQLLDKQKVKKCRKNVDDFYKNPNLQAAWHDFIIHPVCFKVIKDSYEIVPVAIESIGCGQNVMGRYSFIPVGDLRENEMLEQLFVDNSLQND